MEGCLLCLDINKELVDSVKVDSTQWQELNIDKIIEKHLWAMESIVPTSWLCNTCWQEIYNFHKFYLRIEEAHMDFGKLMKTEIELRDHEDVDMEGKYLYSDEEKSKHLVDRGDLNELHLEPEIFLNQLVTGDQQSIIKVEQHEGRQKRTFNLLTNDMETTSKNTLKNINQAKSLKSKKNKIKDEPSFKSNTYIETSFDNSEETELSTIKPNPDPLQMSNESDILHNFSNSDDSFTESDYEPVEEIIKRTKKSDKSSKPRKRDRSKPLEKDVFLAENFKMICVICQLPMSTFKTLLKHFEMEHKERGYAVCCNRKFYKRSSLLEHVNRHVDPNYFKCNQCGKVLSSRKVLKIHQVLHLSEEDKKFACNECGKNFGEQHLLSNHVRSVHLKKYVKICDICGKTLRCSEIFERHMSEHEGKPIPPVNCEICGLLLAHKKALKRHMDIKHPVGGNQPHTCHMCFKVSPNIVALKKHIRCTHNTGNIHKCTVCGRGFKRVQTLRDHMATHTGAALYTCPWCPKTFNSNGCMHAHRKKHHPKEWEEAHRKKYLEKYKVPEVTEIINGGIS